MGTYPVEFKMLEEQIEQLQAENDRLRTAIKYCREYWGESDGIHDCTGKSCVICNIEQALKG